MESGHAVAFAGIIATAVVGVAGSTAGWLIARDNRAHEQALAHDARVYDRRADAYLALMRLVERQRRELWAEEHRLFLLLTRLDDEGPKADTDEVAKSLSGVSERLSMTANADADVYTRVVAFGTAGIVVAYDRMRATVARVWEAESLAEDVNFISLTARALYREIARVQELAERSVPQFEDQQREFQLLVQQELA